MKNTLIIIILLAVGVGIFTFIQSNKNASEEIVLNTNTLTEKDIMLKDSTMEPSLQNETNIALVKEDDIIVKNEAMVNNTIMEKSYGSSVKYESIDTANLSGKIVLNFSASWCPSCRTFKSNLEKELTNIPSDLTIVEVDYDNSTDLKKKYGVTSQHTFVQIDSSGNKITMWSGGTDLASVVSKLK